MSKQLTKDATKCPQRVSSRRRVPKFELIDHITAARDLREINRMLNDLVETFGRYGLLTKEPHKSLLQCSLRIIQARYAASNLFRSQYPGTPDLYFRQDAICR